MTRVEKRNGLLPLQTLLPAALRSSCAPAPSTRGQVLFRQGQKPAQMYFVAGGEVILQRAGWRGENVVLQRSHQGFVAEASLLSARYHCDAVVTIAGTVVSVPIAPIKRALQEDPAFALRWIGMLNHEMQRLRARCERLSLKGVRDRLLHLIETEGEDGRLPLGAGLKSMASELGVTHEALYRSVAEMEKQGLLRREDGALRIG